MPVVRKENFARIALGIVFIHGLIWILLPLIFDGSIRRDVAEGVVDGPLWQIAYLRHPPLSSWLSGLASLAGPFRYAVLYFFSWLLSSGAFLVIGFFLARQTTPLIGMIALLSGLLSPFGTYIPLNLNHNITLMLFTAANLMAIWNAIEKDDWNSWLLAGLVAGLAFWAKYAILFLLGPVGILMLANSDLRRKLMTPRPWVALFVALLITAPQIYHNLYVNESAIKFALTGENDDLTSTERLYYSFEFLLNITLTQASFVIIAFIYAGSNIFQQAWRTFADFRKAPALSQYLTVAAFAPIMIILVNVFLSRRPHFLWVTALSVPFAAYWAYIAYQCKSAGQDREQPLFRAAIIYACLNIFAFSAVRLIAPVTSKNPMNQEIDSRALAKLAENYWYQKSTKPIPFMVNIGSQRGFQRAAGIIFDLPYRVNLLAYGDEARSPWLDLEQFKREGALVVSDKPIDPQLSILGQTLSDVTQFDMPTLRGARTNKIYFARSIPANTNATDNP